MTCVRLPCAEEHHPLWEGLFPSHQVSLLVGWAQGVILLLTTVRSVTAVPAALPRIGWASGCEGELTGLIQLPWRAR